MRPLHAEPPALPRPGSAHPLRRVVSGRNPAVPTDALSLVAKPRGTQVCFYCGVTYDLGEPEGNLFIHYPKGEYRYWNHCLTNAHQRVTQELDRHTAQLLLELRDPMGTRLRRILA